MGAFYSAMTGDDAVIVKQIWTANAYRNFNYLIACSETARPWPSILWIMKSA